VKRALPLWIAAVLPATLAGHALAYALAGQSAADARHAWLAPALELSIALFLAAAAMLFLRLSAAEQSVWALFPRLAFAQAALFSAIELGEGNHVSLSGVLMQIAVALLAACALSLIARLLHRCRTAAEDTGRYLERLRERPLAFVPRRPVFRAYALAVHAGSARFQRPPPHN
jgi:hypothetical protein